MQKFKKFLFLLATHERRAASLLILMILIMAILETIGVASILPFIAVLANPEIVETNIILKKTFQFLKIFGVENNQQFLFALGVIIFLLLIISLIFKSLTTYLQVRFIEMTQYSISKRLMEGYLLQPYTWFLNNHSADLVKNILLEVGQVVGEGIKPIMDLIARGLVAIALIVLLVIADPKLALMVAVTIGGGYGIIYKIIKSYLSKIGEERFKNNQLRFLSLSEAFAAVKEIKVGGLEQTYIKLFSKPSLNYARGQASAGVISQLPRHFLEAIVFGGIMLVIFYLMAQKGNFNNALPIISLYAFAAYRLMPALQQVFMSFTKLTIVGPSLEKVYEDIRNLKLSNFNKNKSTLLFNKEIIFKNIHYNYPNISITALKNINLRIPAKTTVGLVGTTGSGKTTTVDIILGLLEAQKGTLEIDGQIITKQNSRAWQNCIGYVPQHIYLSDNTVAGNIAFGVDPIEINQEAVEKASRIANLHEFVMNELPKKYLTSIGERGIRLSGGQRQRIGIARALYHNPQVLILDEATSALDNETEKAVMDSINNLSKDITIILIAHRLNTVKNCDIIYKLEKGKLIGQGTFDELINGNKGFSLTQ